MFRPITLKQLNSLTSIDVFICIDGADVTHPTAVREVPGSIPGPGRIYCLLVVFVFYIFFVKNTLFVMKYGNSFCNIYSFSILYIL